MLLDEYERWTGDVQLVHDLEYEARAALHWIDAYANLQGNGYLSYQRRNEATGLENQCWKDSWDSIAYHDGRLAGFPRATCELAGYTYDAKMRAARLARSVWGDPAFADQLEKQAADLKERFNRDFWVEDGEFFALALDADGAQVDSLTSNIGHLWSGIVDEAKAERVARHLVGDRLFSGGVSEQWRSARAATTRSVTTSAPSGRSTTPSSPGAFAAMASRMKRQSLPPASGGGGVLRRAAARGVRRLSARYDEVPGAVPHSLQPAGVVDRHTSAVAPDHARSRTSR